MISVDNVDFLDRYIMSYFKLAIFILMNFLNFFLKKKYIHHINIVITSNRLFVYPWMYQYMKGQPDLQHNNTKYRNSGMSK